VKQGKMVFKVYFGMNSVAIDAIAKKNIREHFIIMKSKMTAKSKVTITVEGWVQPNNPPGNITYLSTNRAKNVTAAIKALGLKGTYRLSFPGLAPLNDAKSRYAEVIFTWTDAK
jgi:outer membrane protein OmpA-like peptidoglycan-associated protein